MQFSILILFCFTLSAAFAQKGIVKGKFVFENKDSLMPSIIAQSTNGGVSAKRNGTSTMLLPEEKQKLMIYYIGYEAKSTDVNIIANSTLFVEVFYDNPCRIYAKGKLDKTCPVCDIQDKVIPIL